MVKQGQPPKLATGSPATVCFPELHTLHRFTLRPLLDLEAALACKLGTLDSACAFGELDQALTRVGQRWGDLK